MPKRYNPLPRIPLASDNTFSQPQQPPELVHWDDPAHMVLTSLETVKAVTIHSHAKIKEAELEMKACRVHMLLVSNDAGKVIGIITSEDLLGQKPLMISRERKVHREDILVRAIMTPQEEILTIDFNELKYAKVGDIVATLQDMQKHHALVVKIDAESGQQSITGIFASSQISKQLGKNIRDNLHEAHYLAELLGGLE